MCENHCDRRTNANQFTVLRLPRLHMMCNAGTMEHDRLTGGDIELIQQLEVATDEIEDLLTENDKLTKLSNELRSELNKAKHTSSSDIEYLPKAPTTSNDGERRAYEQTMLDAILNDRSQSCDSDGSRDDIKVACIGRKPPLASSAHSRPSKTAYVSAVLHLMSGFHRIFTS